MNGELAQAICLASHGSSWLGRADESAPPDLDQENSTFRFVGSIRFHLRSRPSISEFTATTVADWLRQLRDRQVSRVWLWVPEPKPAATSGGTVDEHRLVGFANAGRWGLVATAERHSEVWRAFWQVGDRDAPGQRIWSVRYEGVSTGPVSPPRVDLHRAAAGLTAALKNAHGFARRQSMDAWAAWFERALTVAGDIPHHPDMLPLGYTYEARHLAAMAAQAWVFGGMGSWNDVSFENEATAAEYDAVSQNLYNAVLIALEASADSSYETPSEKERL